MRRHHHQVRNHVSDSVEYGFDRLHQIADRCLVYPLAVAEGVIQGAARGVHNMVNHNPHLDRATIAGDDPAAGRCKCKTKTKTKTKTPASSSAYGYGPPPHEFYGYPPPPTPAVPPPPPPPPAAATPQQFLYHPTFPVPCRPSY